jgi:hypothetical protein
VGRGCILDPPFSVRARIGVGERVAQHLPYPPAVSVSRQRVHIPLFPFSDCTPRQLQLHGGPRDSVLCVTKGASRAQAGALSSIFDLVAPGEQLVP